MKPANTKTPKKFWEMNLDELREATKEFDEEMVSYTFRPLTKSQRAQWERAKRKPGRPKTGLGAERISLSVERGLLARADKFAKTHHISRAEMFARGLLAILGPKQSRTASK